MFSKRELKRFLDQVSDVEEKMAACYEGILRDLEDEKLRRIFEGLRDSERQHARRLKDLKSI